MDARSYEANSDKWVFERLPLNDWQYRDLICGLQKECDEKTSALVLQQQQQPPQPPATAAGKKKTRSRRRKRRKDTGYAPPTPTTITADADVDMKE